MRNLELLANPRSHPSSDGCNIVKTFSLDPNNQPNRIEGDNLPLIPLF